jgi:hypothetical protein
LSVVSQHQLNQSDMLLSGHTGTDVAMSGANT